jgi:hypothetical protein
LPSCADDSITLSYSWQAYFEGEVQSFKSSSLDSRKYLLSPYSLNANSLYVFTLTAASVSASKSTLDSASASVWVFVNTGNVVAIVAGKFDGNHHNT